MPVYDFTIESCEDSDLSASVSANFRANRRWSARNVADLKSLLAIKTGLGDFYVSVWPTYIGEPTSRFNVFYPDVSNLTLLECVTHVEHGCIPTSASEDQRTSKALQLVSIHQMMMMASLMERWGDRDWIFKFRSWDSPFLVIRYTEDQYSCFVVPESRALDVMGSMVHLCDMTRESWERSIQDAVLVACGLTPTSGDLVWEP